MNTARPPSTLRAPAMEPSYTPSVKKPPVKNRVSPMGKIYAPGMHPDELSETISGIMRDDEAESKKRPAIYNAKNGEALIDVPPDGRMCDDLPPKK